ncbi:MAG: GatB/YqeY domain-containing protein [Ignavibacteriales bacterium]
MNIKDRLTEDMKKAMKARDEGKVRLSVIRLARAAIRNAEIDQMKEMDDEGVVQVLSREIRQRRDAIAEYQKLGKLDAVKGLEEEISILMEYMSQQMRPEEIAALAREIVAQVGAKGPGDIGKVMGLMMPKVRGKADGRLVSETVKSLLQDIRGDT